MTHRNKYTSQASSLSSVKSSHWLDDLLEEDNDNDNDDDDEAYKKSSLARKNTFLRQGKMRQHRRDRLSELRQVQSAREIEMMFGGGVSVDDDDEEESRRDVMDRLKGYTLTG